MTPPTTSYSETPPRDDARRRIGCVSFLNARPLIDGLDDHPELAVHYDVPAGLLDDLTAGRVDLALCPVIDFQLAERPLTVVPAGGIGCDGPTLTVRLFSRVPLERVDRVLADTDSHTSVVLLQLLMHDLYGSRVGIEPLERGAEVDWSAGPEAILLIGDKVVAAAPPAELYPYQLDLGSAWKTLTQLPFVFAVWMARQDEPLGRAPDLLDRQRRHNAGRVEAIAAESGPRHGWAAPLAAHYLRDLLRYEIGERELQAMQRFWKRAAELALIERHRPLSLHPVPRAEPIESTG